MRNSIASKSEMNEEGRSSVQVIARAASILRALEQRGGRMSLGQLAEATNLPRSTVQRIVSALAAEQLLDVDIAGQGVALGTALARLASAARIDVRQMLRPYLERVSEETNETVDLSLLQQDHVVFVDQVLSSERLRVESAVGSRFPVATTAPGKMLLASLALVEQEHWIRVNKQALGLNTPGKEKSFMKELEKAAREGFAYDLDQHTVGISALAISVRLPGAPAHAISIPVPTARFEQKLSQLRESLRRLRLALAKRGLQLEADARG